MSDDRSIIAESDDDIVEPGDCIGHWLEGDDCCERCEIQDSCRAMTMDLNRDGDDGEEGEEGDEDEEAGNEEERQ